LPFAQEDAIASDGPSASLPPRKGPGKEAKLCFIAVVVNGLLPV
jgi:hypothetical protein